MKSKNYNKQAMYNSLISWADNDISEVHRDFVWDIEKLRVFEWPERRVYDISGPIVVEIIEGEIGRCFGVTIIWWHNQNSGSLIANHTERQPSECVFHDMGHRDPL